MSETPSAAPDQDQDVAESTAEPVVEALGRLFDEPITQLPEDLYIPPEALRVFLDRTSLELSSNLGDSLEKKLGGARNLILLASAESAASEWCDRET